MRRRLPATRNRVLGRASGDIRWFSPAIFRLHFKMAETSTQGSGRNLGTPGLHLRQRFCPPCLTLVLFLSHPWHDLAIVYHGSNLKVVDKRVRHAELVLRCVICGRKSSP
ncbi:uncharacterized protein LOC115997723 [Ipomoea triloba]|uniref:uncharacterized protein LOC115997723 n=1 Tax=Ipomoea triloba TaxID=35885 RepID=UPI00125D0638|nr:uncharacterized protein LOC115997723 [Ipomoea triloba]